MTLDSIPWIVDCHGRSAEVQTKTGWLLVRETDDGYTVRRYGPDMLPVGDVEPVTAAQLKKALAS